MKILRLRLIQSVMICALLLFAMPLRADSNHEADVAALDQILAGVQPGQKLANVGDMQILVSSLVAWRKQLAGGPSLDSAFDGTAPTWTSGNVFYSFSTDTNGGTAVPPNLQKAFSDAAAEWAMFANLHFTARTTQPNYIMVQVLSSLEGGQSVVGMAGGPQLLSISPNAWNRNTLCHEIGHALGLVHEHQRSDRDTNVTIFSNNVASGDIGNFILLPNSRNQGAYDFLSVMHYSRNAFSINPALDTIEPKPAFAQFLNVMGQPGPIVLTALDRAGMAAIYGAGPTLSSVVTNTLDSGPGSLRAALYFAFDHPGTHVTFNIPTNDPGFSNGVFNIQPSDQLPWLVNATTLDGSTQPTNIHSNPSGPLILINGSTTPTPSTFANGLRFGGTNCTARNLIINGFAAYGIMLSGTNVTSNTVAGCYLGTDATGTARVTNGFPGVVVSGGASRNTIGGTTVAARNVISGNTFQGLLIQDAGTVSNVVQGNYVGLNAAGNASLSNMWAGVEISGGAQLNIVGGTTSAARNIISGNGHEGVLVSDVADPNITSVLTNSDGNIIEGNYIGCDPTGSFAISNSFAGIEIFLGPRGTIIGGTAAGASNVISGNGTQGVLVDSGSSGTVIYGNYVGLNAAGTAALANRGAGVFLSGPTTGNLIGGPGAGMRNYIAGNIVQGIYITGAGATNNTVQGNYIGLNAAGTGAVPNQTNGVEIAAAANNLIGGTVTGDGNIISGNGAEGIIIDSPGAAGNVVQGNNIGVNPAGTMAIANLGAGVVLYAGAQSNLIGGTLAGAGNLISGNNGQGVTLQFSGTMFNTVQGNFIGTDSTGTAAIGNGGAGIEVYSGAQSNLIGGLLAGAPNLISGNSAQGVILDFPGTTGNLVQGNFIGVNRLGTGALPNSFAGVEIYDGAQSNTIGGSVPAAGNVISGNGIQGVLIDYPGSDTNLVQGNLIGLNAAGTGVVPNSGPGIEIYNTPKNNLIGGVGAQRNYISGNLAAGVQLDGGSVFNVVQGNTIGQTVAGGVAGNHSQGVAIFNGALSNLVGGLTVGAANVIANSGSDGVDISGATTSGNTVRGNSIFTNANGFGIAAFNGANNSIATPAVTSAAVTTNTTIVASMSGSVGAIFHLDFYASPASSQRQAKLYLGAGDVTIGAGGTGLRTNTPATPVPIGEVITVTATDVNGNTSTLSAGVTVTGTDSVGDGITDAWRRAHFTGTGTSTNSTNCATCDPDHDGLNNKQEFLAGTDPTNATSKLNAGVVSNSPPNVTVNFQSVQGIVYRVDYKNDLNATNWELFADQILGTGGIISLTDSGAASLTKRFYRLDVLP